MHWMKPPFMKNLQHYKTCLLFCHYLTGQQIKPIIASSFIVQKMINTVNLACDTAPNGINT